MVGEGQFLKYHDWPGNIRELQKRAVVMSPGPVLHPALTELKRMTRPSSADSRTLAAAERDHIWRCYGKTDGTIVGQQSAAARLGLPRTTLVYKCAN